MAQISN